MEIQIQGFNRNEVLQYLNWRGSEIPPEVDGLIDSAMGELMQVMRPKYIWRQFSIQRGEELTLPEAGLVLPGEDVKQLLADCDTCILLAATLGAESERLITAAKARDLSRAIVLDCCGSSAIEAVCDRAEEEIRASFPRGYFTDRFSPGYGDLPLDLQPRLTQVLDTPRRIGLTLTDTMILVPRKSVTAIIGVADRPQTKRFRGCAYCNLFEHCTYRKAGKVCGRG
jgi:hypothetical protein